MHHSFILTDAEIEACDADDYTPPRLRTPQPTLARPGSEMKIIVLQSRVEHGEYLFHDDDYREPELNMILIVSTGADRAAMGCKLLGNGKSKRSARIGFYREPK